MPDCAAILQYPVVFVRIPECNHMSLHQMFGSVLYRADLRCSFAVYFVIFSTISEN